MTAKIVAIAAAGALGTLARQGLAGLIHKLNATAFPWGTLAVNLSGCFLVSEKIPHFRQRNGVKYDKFTG